MEVVAKNPQEAEEVRWLPVLDLPCQVAVDVELPDFRVRDFLGLGLGSVLSTQLGVTHDLPLRVNGILIGWGELEGANKGLAIRVTELA
jgi:flagellar motor switch/type III secretory pathway protein FliN